MYVVTCRIMSMSQLVALLTLIVSGLKVLFAKRRLTVIYTKLYLPFNKLIMECGRINCRIDLIYAGATVLAAFFLYLMIV